MLDIGTVAQVVAAEDGGPGHLLVERGLPSADAHIPLDAVTKVADSVAFIHAPRIMIGALPWDEPPTEESRSAKLEHPMADVAALYRSRSPSIDRRG